MPTIHREAGFRFFIHLNDHEPSHVHVSKAGGEARIQIGTLGSEMPSLLSVSPGMSDKDASKALAIAWQQQEKFLREWRRIHHEQ